MLETPEVEYNTGRDEWTEAEWTEAEPEAPVRAEVPPAFTPFTEPRRATDVAPALVYLRKTNTKVEITRFDDETPLNEQENEYVKSIFDNMRA